MVKLSSIANGAVLPGFSGSVTAIETVAVTQLPEASQTS